MHGQAQHHERDDLTQAGQGRVEALDLPLERGTLVAQDNAGHKDRKEP